MMNGPGKSDSSVVPEKPSNEARRRGEERVEGRELVKGNLREQNTSRTLGRSDVHSALERVREAAQKEKRQRFTALFHHVYAVECLRAAYFATRKDAAAGVDGETWQHYGKDLEANLQDLSERLQRGAYRAKPVRRVYILKADGRQRPLGVPALEDKIVQRAVVEVLNAVYEQDFLGISYGFRPGRGQHDALDALAVALQTRKVNWVLDADIRSFFDTLDHGWLVKFIEHRIADRRIVRLIQKWLSAGVLEEGERIVSEVGTVQGGSISPLLANLYLHYVFDRWAQRWRQKHAQGEVAVVRYADDSIVGFEHQQDAEQFLLQLRERLGRFGLELHPDKTRLIPFGRYVHREWENGRGDKPGTFDFLGFTHVCAKSRRGKFIIQRRTMRKRLHAKLVSVKQELRRRMHEPIKEQGAYLSAVMRGHFQYYGVPMNGAALSVFWRALVRLWGQSLSRRSQQGRVSQSRLHDLARRFLPPVRICHPYPWVRFNVTTRGRSPVR